VANKSEREIVAERVIIDLVDDIDGGTASEKIRFSYRGADYEIDLSSRNAATFDKAVEKYIARARRAKNAGGQRSRRISGSSLSIAERAEIRAWARKRRIKVSQRGRIGADVIAQFRTASK
jgi:hypothetical protein